MQRKQLALLDLLKLVQELSSLNDAVIRNIKSKKNELYILLFKNVEQWLKIMPGQGVYLTNDKPQDAVDFPFTSLLKSELKGRRISVSLHDSDRIIELSCGDSKLIIELFSNGNVILVRDNLIRMALYAREYGYRKIAAGEEYHYPPESKDLVNVDKAGFGRLLDSSNKDSVVKALAVDFALGGTYAEELCFRTGIKSATPINALSQSDKQNLYSAMDSMLRRELKPNIVDARLLSAVELAHLGGKKTYFDSMNAAVKTFLESVPVSAEEVKKPGEEKSAQMEKYLGVIDFINNNYSALSEALDLVLNSKISLGERRKRLETLGWALNGKVLSNLVNRDVEIDVTLSLNENLSVYYDRVKRMKRGLSKYTEKRRIAKLSLIRGEAWYAKFLWFMTSGNKLVVIAKDSNQNASLISKHVEKYDLVFHADVFGSPFGVLKLSSEERASETDITEAAQIVASFSSGWKAGAGNLDVYYVGPEQITKSPPSGEYLKKGAFYIAGKRNYVKSAPMMVFIAVSIEGDKCRLALSASQPKTSFLLLKPGNMKREDVIKKILDAARKKLGVELPRDGIDSLMPAGRCRLERISF